MGTQDHAKTLGALPDLVKPDLKSHKFKAAKNSFTNPQIHAKFQNNICSNNIIKI
jgi:hypothetical protein